MASACALAIISGKNIFYFGVQKRLRAFLYPIFTGGVVKGNGICSACFLRKRRRCRAAGSPSQSPTVTAPPKGEPLAKPRTLHVSRKLCRHAKGSPFGRAGALAPERARTLAG